MDPKETASEDPEKRKVLRRVRAFSDLGDAECDAVLAVLRARRGAPGDVLFREGDRGDSLMIVLEGELVASVRSEGVPRAGAMGEEVARLGPGEVVGEMAFLDAEPRSATVSTPRGATVLEFSREALARLSITAPRVAAAVQRNVLSDVARRLREAGEKLQEDGPQGPAAGPASMRGPSRGLTAEQLRDLLVATPASRVAFAGYTPADLELLAYIATLRRFAPGDVVMEEGTEGDACWLIVSGGVSVTREGGGGSASPLATLGPGALVGQLALLDRAPRSASVTALGETLTLELRGAAFSNLVASSSPVALRFQAQVALAGVRQLRVATRRMAATGAAGAVAGAYSAGGLRQLDVDDWDDGDAPALELAVQPASLRRPL